MNREYAGWFTRKILRTSYANGWLRRGSSKSFWAAQRSSDMEQMPFWIHQNLEVYEQMTSISPVFKH